MDEINIIDHRSKSSRSLPLTAMKEKYTSDENVIQHKSPTCPKESETDALMENSPDSRQYYLRSRFSFSETGMISKSLSKHVNIKSNQSTTSADTAKNNSSTETCQRNENVVEELDKKKISGKKKLALTCNKELASKRKSESHKQINTPFSLVSSSPENVKDKEIDVIDENKINDTASCQEQNHVNCNNITSGITNDISLQDFKRKMKRKVTASVDNEKCHLEISDVNLRKPQIINKINLKKTGGSEVFSSDCQEMDSSLQASREKNQSQPVTTASGNDLISSDCQEMDSSLQASREKNQSQPVTTASGNDDQKFAVPSKNVSKRKKLDSDKNSRVQSAAKLTKMAMSSLDNSVVGQSVKNEVRKGNDTNIEDNDTEVSGKRKRRKTSDSGNYTRMSERILEKNRKILQKRFGLY